MNLFGITLGSGRSGLEHEGDAHGRAKPRQSAGCVGDAAVKHHHAPGLGQDRLKDVAGVVDEHRLARPLRLPDRVDVENRRVVAGLTAIDMGIAFNAKGVGIGIAAHQRMPREMLLLELQPQIVDGSQVGVVEQHMLVIFLVRVLGFQEIMVPATEWHLLPVGLPAVGPEHLALKKVLNGAELIGSQVVVNLTEAIHACSRFDF